MKAKLLVKDKIVFADGSLIEIVVWQVPKPVPPSEHSYKYRLVYIKNNLRVVGFDNERGKGDHMHIDDIEVSYTFINVKQLIQDFVLEVNKWR